MPGCTFHASGEAFSVDEFLAASSLTPYRVYHRGEQNGRGELWQESGFCVDVSDEGDDFSAECREVLHFLQEFELELSRLGHFPGVSDRRLDLGYFRRDVEVQCDYLPPEVLALAGSLGIGIELSLYPQPVEEADDDI